MEKGRFFPTSSRLFAAFPGISHLFPHRFLLSQMNLNEIQMEPTPHPLPRVGTRGRGAVFWAGLPRVAPKRHGATTGLSGANSLRLVQCAAPRTGVSSDFCRKKCGLLRVVTRSFTKVRTDQARKSSMLRIVTGGTNFRRELHE